MNTPNHITTELVQAIAQAPYTGPDAPCPWEAVQPLTQYALKARVLEFLKTALPILEAHGWTPPTPPTPPAPPAPPAPQETGTFGACCTDGSCCGPGSYCCSHTGPHTHPEEDQDPS